MHRRASYTQHRRSVAKRRGYLAPEPANDHAPHASRSQRLYRANLRYGTDLQDRAVEAFASGELPEWYVAIRPGDQADDQAGIDLWCETHDGSVAVQVKSSAARAAEFREDHPGMEVAIVVLHMTMAHEVIRVRVLEAVFRVLVGRGRKAA